MQTRGWTPDLATLSAERGEPQVSILSPTGFGFESLDAHPERPGNFIMLEFALDDWGQTVLHVDSYGPEDGFTNQSPISEANRVIAHTAWQQFAMAMSTVAGQHLQSFPCCPGR